MATLKHFVIVTNPTVRRRCLNYPHFRVVQRDFKPVLSGLGQKPLFKILLAKLKPTAQLDPTDLVRVVGLE